jgi:hypothetical protein
MSPSNRTSGALAAPSPARHRSTVSFCGRCGELSAKGFRVCGRCGQGLMLTCEGGAEPPIPGTPFLVVGADLVVGAVSKAAETPLGSKEGKLVGADLGDLLTSPLGDEVLLRHVEQAAGRPRAPVAVPVRAPGADGLLAARVGTCGPPRGALLVLEPSSFGRR